MKSLVIYFSHTGKNYMKDGIRNIEKGNTEIAAKIISDVTFADIFEVKPVLEYPYNYKECCNKALKEIDSNARPFFVSLPSNMDDYDVIYVGGSVWCGHYPCVFA